MADIHVLTGTRRGHHIGTTVAFHFTVPLEHRVAEAIQDPELASFESAVPDIAQTELDAIKAGQVIEITAVIMHHYEANDATVLQKARNLYAKMGSNAINDYRARYWRFLQTFTR